MDEVERLRLELAYDQTNEALVERLLQLGQRVEALYDPGPGFNPALVDWYEVTGWACTNLRWAAGGPHSHYGSGVVYRPTRRFRCLGGGA